MHKFGCAYRRTSMLTWVVLAIATRVAIEGWKVVVLHWIGIRMPRFIFGLGVGSCCIIGTICTWRIPFFTAISWLIKQVVSIEAYYCASITTWMLEWYTREKSCLQMSSNRLLLTFLLHPVLIVFPSNAIQFANKVRKPGRLMICLSSPIMCSVGWWPWSMFICAWEVYGPWEGCMRVFAIFQARRRSWEVFITTFLRGTIDFKVVWLMQFWFTMARFLIRVPGTIPSRWTSSPWVRIDRLSARSIAVREKARTLV